MLTLTNADIGELLRADPPNEESIFHAALALKKLPEFESKTLAELASVACQELLYCRQVALVEIRHHRELLERLRKDKVFERAQEEEASRYVTKKRRSDRARDWFRRYLNAIEQGKVAFSWSERVEILGGRDKGWRRIDLELLKSKYPTWQQSEISAARAGSRKKSKK